MSWTNELIVYWFQGQRGFLALPFEMKGETPIAEDSFLGFYPVEKYNPCVGSCLCADYVFEGEPEIVIGNVTDDFNMCRLHGGQFMTKKGYESYRAYMMLRMHHRRV